MTTTTSPTRLLFTGYAPVHYLCFRPLLERLRTRDDVEVFVSGGLRTRSDGGFAYDTHGLYGPLGVPAEHVMDVERLKDESFDVLFSASTSLIEPRRVGKRVQIFHGVSFRNRAIRPENMGCDWFFLVGPYMRRRFEEAKLLSRNDPRAVSIGFMKTDALLNGQLDRTTILERYGFDGRRPVVLYAPTGARYNSMEMMGEQVLERLLRTDRYDVLVKLHDHPKNREIDWTQRLRPLEGDHLRVADELDVIPLLHAADLLISDASSVTSEYAMLDRPMVFLDVPKLLSRAAKLEGSMLDVDLGRWSGLVVTDPRSVATAVDQLMQMPDLHARLRQATSRRLFYNPGYATDAAEAWLEEQVLGSSRVRRAS